MKKFYFLFLLGILTIGVNAQRADVPTQRFKNFAPYRLQKRIPTRDTIGPLFMNYYAFDYLTDTSSSVYTANRGYLLNSRYNKADTAGAFGNNIFSYFVVAFDTFFDYNTGDTYPQGSYNTLNLDTIIIRAGWEQNSVNNDTTKISVLQLSSKGYPTALILWDTLLIHSLGSTPDNQWNFLADIKVAPNLHINKKGFGIKVEYYGDKTDTFAFINGYPLDGSGCPAKSNYFPNSYSFWSDFGFLDPQPGGVQDVYTNCQGSQTASVIEDIDLGVYVTLQSPSGVQNINPDISNISAYPNPTSGDAFINFTMSKASAYSFLTVYDITGKAVYSNNPEHLSAGKHIQQINTSTFAPGIYTYSITTEHGKTFGKLVKQ